MLNMIAEMVISTMDTVGIVLVHTAVIISLVFTFASYAVVLATLVSMYINASKTLKFIYSHSVLQYLVPAMMTFVIARILF